MSEIKWIVQPSPFTPGKLYVNKIGSGLNNDVIVFHNDNDMARRIAACLNFFDGIPIEAIDALVKNRQGFEKILEETRHSGMRKVVEDAFKGMNDGNKNNPR